MVNFNLQMAMADNPECPFLLIWALDQTIPAVHTFDMQLISSLPIPTIIKTYLGFS